MSIRQLSDRRRVESVPYRGLVPHQGSRNLGMLMLGFALCALGAHIALRRQRSHAFASK